MKLESIAPDTAKAARKRIPGDRRLDECLDRPTFFPRLVRRRPEQFEAIASGRGDGEGQEEKEGDESTHGSGYLE
jgi:hypothetical protein